jgi:ATP-dependent DNA helicase RecG
MGRGINHVYAKISQARHRRADQVAGGAKIGVGGVSGVENLLSIISSQPGLRANALKELAGIPARTVERWLQQLKVSGAIEFRGIPKTGGYYVADKKEDM